MTNTVRRAVTYLLGDTIGMADGIIQRCVERLFLHKTELGNICTQDVSSIRGTSLMG